MEVEAMINHNVVPEVGLVIKLELRQFSTSEQPTFQSKHSGGQNGSN